MNRFVVRTLTCLIALSAVACSWLSDPAPQLTAEPDTVTAPSATKVGPDGASQDIAGDTSPSEGDPDATAEDAPSGNLSPGKVKLD